MEITTIGIDLAKKVFQVQGVNDNSKVLLRKQLRRELVPALGMRTLFVATATTACCGCLHSPPSYPGAGGKNLEPASYASSVCPDLSGK